MPTHNTETTNTGRASVSELNVRIWLLRNPLAELDLAEDTPSLQSTPVFVRELLGGKAQLLGADLKPLTGEVHTLEELKALYGGEEGQSMDYALSRDLLKTVKGATHQLDSKTSAFARLAAGRIFIAAVRSGVAERLEDWVECERILERKRYTAHVWFERDRSNVRLVDELTGMDVVDLWDEAVEEAIEDGFLRAPNGPRPDEAQWREPLLRYALQTGAIEPSMQVRPPPPPPIVGRAMASAPTSDSPSP